MTRKLKFVTQPASIIQVEILPLDNNNKTMTIFFAIVALWVSVFCTTEAFSSPTFGTLQQQQRQRFASSLMSAASETQQQEEVESPSQQQQLTLFSPCKINLFLRIIRKREDGYHDLASLFQAIGFGDTLHLQVLQEDDDDETEITEDTFTCNMPGVPTDQSNLVLRALTLMREKTGQKVYFNADLIKECPAQAGLGGGSANAATAMFGANELMGRPATLDQLVEWSGDIGSDITFFLSRGTAYCTGRGEIMTPMDPPLPAGTPLCIVKPNIGLSTPAVFKSLDYDQLSTADPEELLQDFLDSEGGVESVDASRYINDLEPPAFANVPALSVLKDQLQKVEGFRHVLMSGSGTSLFCLGQPTDREAFDAEFGQRPDLQVFYAQFLNRPEGVWYQRPE